MLEQVRIKVREKKKSLELSGKLNEENEKIINLIEDLLSDNTCFIKLDISMAVIILVFLGYTKSEAKEIYVSLTQESAKSLHGKYSLVDLDDNILRK